MTCGRDWPHSPSACLSGSRRKSDRVVINSGYIGFKNLTACKAKSNGYRRSLGVKTRILPRGGRVKHSMAFMNCRAQRSVNQTLGGQIF